MLDPKIFKSQEAITLLKKNLIKRHYDTPENLDSILNNQKKNQIKIETLQSKRNEYSKKIGILLSQKKQEESEKLKKEMLTLNKELEEHKQKQDIIEEDYHTLILNLPNMIDHDVPEGKSEEKNKVIYQNKDKPSFSFTILPHHELATKEKLIDFERGIKLSGSRFYVLNEELSKLERHLAHFLLKKHATKGYKERSVPFIVSNQCFIGTGQLPKFHGEFYEIESDKMSLIPTAEVALTNLYANEIIEEQELPIYLMSFTPCFRREAGSAGKDTKGLIRVHQFQKVELVKFVKPTNSNQELNLLVENVKDVLDVLGLTYRVVLLCSGDTGFSSAKTYDLEIWMPGMNRWLEISSCSNFLDFQTRRAKIRFKNTSSDKNEYLHTLNGSGVATGRLIAALLEYYQNSSGSVDWETIYKKLDG